MHTINTSKNQHQFLCWANLGILVLTDDLLICQWPPISYCVKRAAGSSTPLSIATAGHCKVRPTESNQYFKNQTPGLEPTRQTLWSNGRHSTRASQLVLLSSPAADRWWVMNLKELTWVEWDGWGMSELKSILAHVLVKASTWRPRSFSAYTAKWFFMEFSHLTEDMCVTGVQ